MVEVQRHDPDDDSAWIEASHDGVEYRFTVVGEDELELRETSQDAKVGKEPPEPVRDRLASMGYHEVRT
ncbi:hypothetical protein [Halovivax sp.]|uniref:hypothetical protein n=1 Tax=Halovivax sp. TaxID=1935978 RepID=UPI0025BBEE59|nr:hypothetical protein [Halovivax sp.]